MSSPNELASQVKETQKKWLAVKKEIGRIIVGQTHLVDCLLIGLLSDGHLLLEGLPGLAKTLAITTLSKVCQVDCKRVQFTPDLLPSDLIGTTIYNPKEAIFEVSPGPIFTNLFLADEINRAPPKVQSALLEVMQEKQVTLNGKTFKIEPPYLVLATQNPIEQEGTYPLPEAQTDRFMMKVKIGYPTKEEEAEIINRMSALSKRPEAKPVLSKTDILDARKLVENIYIDLKVVEFILDIVQATRVPHKETEGLIQLGASPRASLFLVQAAKALAFLSGRSFVTPEDVKALSPEILRHRIKPSYEAEAQEISSDEIIRRIFNKVLVP